MDACERENLKMHLDTRKRELAALRSDERLYARRGRYEMARLKRECADYVAEFIGNLERELDMGRCDHALDGMGAASASKRQARGLPAPRRCNRPAIGYAENGFRFCEEHA
jgi:hypothetical protein